jgi:hypothetical protein
MPAGCFLKTKERRTENRGIYSGPGPAPGECSWRQTLQAWRLAQRTPGKVTRPQMERMQRPQTTMGSWWNLCLVLTRVGA